MRWGIVGTGVIANAMADMIRTAEASAIAAVASRRMESAQQFADAHGVPGAFGDWREMIRSASVDAVYVATPTGLREEICIAAAKAGKHVLGEKPFASLASVERITAACRDQDVAFMDATHFVHHPRTLYIRQHSGELFGTLRSVASAFQFGFADHDNIRFDRELEPMGAIGDAGWYNMRAAVEYLPPGSKLESASAHLQRDPATGAASSGAGVLLFNEGMTSSWHCGFDSGAAVMDLRISGTEGVVNIDDFLIQKPDGSADYLYRRDGNDTAETINIPSLKPCAALMFEDLAAAAADPSLREQWMTATERTQALLDAAWAAARQSEKGSS